MPPKVTKQTSTLLTSRQDGNLGHRRPKKGIRLNVYGRGKTGKTRLVCTFPKPMLLIGTEDGTDSVSTDQELRERLPCGAEVMALTLRGQPTGIDFVRLHHSDWLEDVVRILESGYYKTASLDHAGGLQDVIVKEVLGLAEIPVQRSWGMAQQKDWGIIGQQTKERLSKLLALSERLGIHVPVIAHERSFGGEDTSMDAMLPSIGPALTPTTAAWLNGACDYVCQTFIREEVKVDTLKIGGKDSGQEVRTKTGTKEYCLRVGPHPVYMTGFRLPPGVDLPDAIVNPTYEKIQALIRGEEVPA